MDNVLNLCAAFNKETFLPICAGFIWLVSFFITNNPYLCMARVLLCVATFAWGKLDNKKGNAKKHSLLDIITFNGKIFGIFSFSRKV